MFDMARFVCTPSRNCARFLVWNLLSHIDIQH
jgi:hypothetical protein